MRSVYLLQSILTAFDLKVSRIEHRSSFVLLRPNVLDHDADIDKVQEWLGHANIATTKIYDRRKMKPEDSPTFKVSY
jgi:site-specific recombinase XerD